MSATETLKIKGIEDRGELGGWPGIASRFQLVILAGLRSKQLLHGAKARINVDPLKRRNTSIALEELKRGLIPFSGLNGDHVQGTAIAHAESE